jgi:hypothetical protein
VAYTCATTSFSDDLNRLFIERCIYDACRCSSEIGNTSAACVANTLNSLLMEHINSNLKAVQV